ncbi:hypothetical protein NI392_07540 [Vibrio alginolyticus]|jgi:hypothetical protein|uniref:hypothetical protein n=1 Tax=Vibrio TaxID=662 RepID=UPI00112272A4|nr:MULTISPECIES: hypothetical protein [Vibrio]MDW3057883.1 hypothetical protein [Vibrio sp. 1978]TOL78782.1 hypothetical protein CGH90_19695 [Vibrio parahaemolyticus]WMN45757.1 hypothetical protein NI392_07540 [Vibrio alginolyticus]HCG5125834.1 hypothetical protein [Vibrio parahaemolyticus]HCG6498689.1 hypothetical protein [Vibrio parahaemolyticus]
MKASKNIILIGASTTVLLSPLAESEPDPEYIAARTASWQGYVAIKEKAEAVKESSGLAFNVCSFISETTRPQYRQEEDKLFCKLSKQHGDWIWFELAGGGSVYCGNYYAVAMNGVNPVAMVSSNGCIEDYTITVMDGMHEVDNTALLEIDGQLFNYDYKTYDSGELLDSFANADDRVTLLYAKENRIETVNLSTRGSSAALRFLGLIE